jgi:hypothetical protein
VGLYGVHVERIADRMRQSKQGFDIVMVPHMASSVERTAAIEPSAPRLSGPPLMSTILFKAFMWIPGSVQSPVMFCNR